MIIGKKVRAIAEVYIPPDSTRPEPQITSHKTACILNTTNEVVQIELHIYFSYKDPVGPYHIKVPPNRTKHLRFNDLTNPTPVPRGTDYASVSISNVPTSGLINI